MNQLMLNSSEATWRTSVSGIMGSTSLACWIVLLMPQLIEQWRLKSADGVSIGFIFDLVLGDVFNLIGALWAGLLPEVIFLAVWFCIADAMMILSYFYYTRMYPKHHKVHHHGHEHHHHHHEHESNQVRDHEEDHAHHHHGEDAPLLRRRRSSTLTDIAIEPKYHSIFIKYVLPIFFVFGAGCLGYFLSDSKEPEEPSSNIEMGPQVMGYLSAVLYLGARIPQIIRNHQRKSVEGLSLLFFLFSTLGNITYASQIIFYRSDSQYIILNLSWLLGSLGTIFEDCFIFLQFYMYKDNIDKNEGVN